MSWTVVRWIEHLFSCSSVSPFFLFLSALHFWHFPQAVCGDRVQPFSSSMCGGHSDDLSIHSYQRYSQRRTPSDPDSKHKLAGRGRNPLTVSVRCLVLYLVLLFSLLVSKTRQLETKAGAISLLDQTSPTGFNFEIVWRTHNHESEASEVKTSVCA